MFENIVHSIYIILLIVHNTQLQSIQNDWKKNAYLQFFLAFTNIRWELSSVQYNTSMSSNISPENWSQYRTTDWFKHITWELKLQYFRPVQTYYLKTDYSTVQQTGSNRLAENWLQYSTTDRFKHITWELTTVQHSDRFKLSRLLKSNVDLKRRILSGSFT